MLPFLAALMEKLNLLFSRNKPEVLALQELISKFTRKDLADKIVPLLHTYECDLSGSVEVAEA